MHKSSLPHLEWQRLPGHRHLKGRAGHTANLVGKDIYVLGGRNGNVFFNDMWVFDTEVELWKLVQAKTPFSPRAYHTCTVVKNRELWVIGGSDPTTMYSDVHVYDTVSLKWSSPVLSGPCAMKPRGTHAAVLHPIKSLSILVYGGYGSESCWMNDLVILHTDTLEWDELKPNGIRPSGRGYHTLTAYNKLAVLFGGKAEGGIVKDDKISIYNADTNEWIVPSVKGDLPSPRSNHASALLDNGLIIFHGGRHGSMRLSDTYVLQIPPAVDFSWDLEVRCHVIEKSKNATVQRKHVGNSPSGRSAHTLVGKGPSVYVFGGYGGEGLTYNDIFVLRKFPKLPEFTEKPPYRASEPRIFPEVTSATDEGDGRGEESDGEAEVGWRTTKRAKLDSIKKGDGVPNSDAIILQAKTPKRKHKSVLNSPKDKVAFAASETRSTEPMADGLKFQSRDTVITSVFQKELNPAQVRSLQQSVETLTATIQQKALVDSNAKDKSMQLEQDMESLKKENFELHSSVSEIKKELSIQSKRTQKIEQEKRKYESLVQDLNLELEKKECVLNSEAVRSNELEKQLKELRKLLEEHKLGNSEVALERDKYKLCIQTLEAEVEKQMDALRQLRSRYDTEKAFLLKEIAERKGASDRLLTDLGAAKEYSRSLEENANRLSKQIEQETTKIGILQIEKEAFACSNAVLASEHKQLSEAKEVSDATSCCLRSELQAARSLLEQTETEKTRLKESVEQAKEHASILHDSLKKEEAMRAQNEELEKLRMLVRESEDFEQGQARLIQAHAEKLRCARQSCPC